MNDIDIAYPVVEHLVRGWKNRDLEAVEISLEELENAKEKQIETRALLELGEELESILPKTVAAIRQNEVLPFTKEKLEKEIFSRKLEKFIDEALAKSGDPNAQLATLKTVNQQIETLISQLVAEKTWASKASHNHR